MKVLCLTLFMFALFFSSQEKEVTLVFKINGLMELKEANLQITNLRTLSHTHPNIYSRIKVHVLENDRIEITGNNIFYKTL